LPCARCANGFDDLGHVAGLRNGDLDRGGACAALVLGSGCLLRGEIFKIGLIPAIGCPAQQDQYQQLLEE